MLYSPINYPGNKSRISDVISEILPEGIETIYDVFCGSGIIGLNAKSKKTVLNDKDPIVIDLLKYFKENNSSKIISNVDSIIKKFGLTNTYYVGKAKYTQKKNEGLSNYNREGFNKLKKAYNNDKDIEKLFTLIIYGFNHYIRFNKNGEFNVPVGKIDFVESLRLKTKDYCLALNNKKVSLLNLDFRNKKLYSKATKNDLFYFDPPYLISMAPYNSFWDSKDEKDLLKLLDSLNSKGLRFALSNVISSNGKENVMLKKWMNKYKVHYIKRQYLNSNYRKKNITRAIEVLVTNF